MRKFVRYFSTDWFVPRMAEWGHVLKASLTGDSRSKYYVQTS
jgi:hypothetical protein